jgi:hypothetical protein
MTYELIAAGEIEVIHVGAVIRVPVDELENFIDRQRFTDPPDPKSVSSGSRSRSKRHRTIADASAPRTSEQQLGLPL